MQNASLGRTLAILVLAIAVAIIYAPKLFSDRVPSTLIYNTDLDFWQATQRRQRVETKMPIDMAHGLDSVPLRMGNWHGVDVPQTNLEVFILLEPEQYVQRKYEDDAGHIIWLTLIGSHKSKSFHPPDLCYDADGWLTDLSSRAIALPEGGEIYGLWLSAKKNEIAHRVFYFYLLPTDDSNAVVLFRITSEPFGTDEETLTIQGDFLSHFLRRTR